MRWTKYGAVRWTKCPFGRRALPQCLILLPKDTPKIESAGSNWGRYELIFSP